MKKCVIYGRVSKTDVQDYGRQVYELRTFAKKNDYQIVAEFTEKISGTKEHREQFNAMLEYIRANKIKSILVTELTRLGRLGHKTRDLIEDITSTGVDIYFKDKGLHTLKDGKRDDINMMVIGLLCDLAQQELVNLKNRITSGLRYAVSKGSGKSGTYMPYGFVKNEHKQLVIDKEEAKVIKLIFKKYIEGLGTPNITALLNEQSIPTRFNIALKNRATKTKTGIVKDGDAFKWSTGTVIGILKNPIYKGDRMHKDEVFKIDPIIDAATFDNVQQIMKQKGNRMIKTIKNDNFLKGIIKCGVCGQPYYMHKRKDGKDSAYKCMSKKLNYEGKNIKCNSPSVGIDKLLNSIIAEQSHIVELTQHIQNQNKAANNFDEQLIELEKEMQKLKKRHENLLDMREDGSINKKEFTQRKEKIDALVSETQSKIETVNKKKISTSTKIDSTDILPQIHKALKQITIAPPTKKELNKLPFDKNEVVIKVTLTSKLDETYSTTYYLSRYRDNTVKENNSMVFERNEYLRAVNEYIKN